jgi:LemA protein
MKTILGVLLGVVVLGGIYYWTTYNSLVALNENVDNQWAQVETQYQRRFDLIPNLVESVKGIMAQEQTIFTAIAEARTRYSGASSVNDKAAAATEMEGALGRLLVVMENYPQLRSSENVQQLMVQLEGTENRISVERKRFNDMVRDYNVRIKQIPARWIASSLGYSERNYFEAVEGSEAAPAVKLTD